MVCFLNIENNQQRASSIIDGIYKHPRMHWSAEFKACEMPGSPRVEARYNVHSSTAVLGCAMYWYASVRLSSAQGLPRIYCLCVCLQFEVCFTNMNVSTVHVRAKCLATCKPPSGNDHMVC